MERQTHELVAEAFGAAPELLPLLPALFADFTALGGWPDKVATILRESAQLPQEAAVVDLGCGKGAVSLVLAAELGYRVTGFDLFEPFLEDAASGARAAGVHHLCSFEVADIRDRAEAVAAFDVAIFAAVGAGLYGDYSDCIAAIRRWTRPDGYIVISDGFLKQPIPPGAKFPGYGYYERHDEALHQLTAHGDAFAEGSRGSLRLTRSIVSS
jgi:SAM-dependent methyltransferase